MSPAFGILLLALVLLVVVAWPTRSRLERAFTPKQGPHPVARGLRHLWSLPARIGERRRRAARKRRERHLRAVR